MRDGPDNDLVITAAFGLVGLAAIVTPLAMAHSPVRFLSVFGAVLLGPGSLAYRLATGRRWGECFAVGIPLTVGIVMLLGLILVYTHAWHPIPLELLIPAATCLMSGYVLYRDRFGRPAPRAEETRTASPGAKATF